MLMKQCLHMIEIERLGVIEKSERRAGTKRW